MLKQKKLLIIPAKSFSSRLKNKNFKKFCGKMIIEYPYNAAKKSKLFDKIHISTESEEIKRKLEKKKIYIDFLRDKNLTNKNIGLYEVYKFVYFTYKKLFQNFDQIWCLLPCSPLITSKDLLDLNEKIIKKKIKLPLISICKYNAPIEWAFKKTSGSKLYPYFKKKQNLPSQNFKNTFFDVGVLSVFDKKNFKKQHKFFKGNFHGYELPFEKSVDIDNIQDWEFAQKLFKLQK